MAACYSVEMRGLEPPAVEEREGPVRCSLLHLERPRVARDDERNRVDLRAYPA